MGRAAVLRISFFLALPFDIGLGQNSTATVLDNNEPIEGWESFDAPMVPGGMTFSGLLPHLGPGLRPLTAFWFRRVRVRGVRPFAAVDRAFGDVLWRGEGRLARARNKIKWLRAPSTLRGIETRVVVQITRLVQVDDETAHVSHTHPHDRWTRSQFETALAKLNEFLIAAGAASGDPAIGPVTPGDLPMAVPFLVGRFAGPSDRSLLLLHPGAQGQADELTPEQLSHITNLTARQHGPGHPFFPMGEAMVEARRALARGRDAHAVLEVSIAFELLIATIVREVGTIRGYPESRVARVLDAGLKNVLNDHVPRLIGMPVDLDDAQTPLGRWRRDAYNLRNRVVHQGYSPSHQEAQDAREAVHAVIDAIGACLAADNTTEELARLLIADEPGDSTPPRGAGSTHR